MGGVVGRLQVVIGKAGKFGSRGGGWPPGPAKAPGVKCVPSSLDRVSPASAMVVEEQLVSLTDADDDVVVVVVIGTLLLAFALTVVGSDLMGVAFSVDSFFAASCRMYSS